MAGPCRVMCSAPTVATPRPLKTKPAVETREVGRNGGCGGGGFNLGFVDYNSSSTRPSKTGGDQFAESLHVGAAAAKLANPPCTLAFVYGTLKQGFSNHWLIEDVIAKGHARFIGVAKTKQRFPLVCGPFQVPFLLNMPSCGCHVKGELYAVDRSAIALLDELEGVSKGHNMRRPLKLTGLQSLQVNYPAGDIQAEAYFAAPALTQGLASAPHIEGYTKRETVDYVRRKDRPQNRTFLDHVHHWIETQDAMTARV